jgi:hypothetical protein
MGAIKPDYATARTEAGFGWAASATQGALREITDTPIRNFNLDPPTCIDAYRRGRPLLRDMFGFDVSLPGLCTPAVSYGHVNCLGSELLFPEGGEVAHTHIYNSLEQGIAALHEPVDWSGAGMAPFFLRFCEQMQEAFPGETVGFTFGAEGALTTAYELRGDGFFIDIFDDLPRAQEFLRLVVDSSLSFDEFQARVQGREFFSPDGAGMVDDIAAFIPPHLFPVLVLPAWEQYYAGCTAGRRSAHVEDLRVAQLPFLEKIGLSFFDPSISPRLNPRLIHEHCRVPFGWLLQSFHYHEMTCSEVEDFVFQAAADGASAVNTHISETMCNHETVLKVEAFVKAAKQAKALLEAGGSREELRDYVSAEGREKLWESWCGFLSPTSSRGGARA